MHHRIIPWYTSQVTVMMSLAPWRVLLLEQFRGELGYAKLTEVAVKGEGVANIEPLHQHKARGIGEGKVSIVVAIDDPFRPQLILLADADESRVALFQIAEKRLPLRDPQGREHQGMRFIEDDIARIMAKVLSSQPRQDGHGFIMVLVVTVAQGKVG